MMLDTSFIQIEDFEFGVEPVLEIHEDLLLLVTIVSILLKFIV